MNTFFVQKRRQHFLITVIEDLEELKPTLQKVLETKLNGKTLTEKKVFLKPNLGYPKPAPYTTSIPLMKEVVKLFSIIGVKQIIIGEGSTSKSSSLENYRRTGMQEALEGYNVKFIDLGNKESTPVTIGETTHFLPKVLLETNFRISLPVIKLYNDDKGKPFISNAVKNFFGLPPKDKYKSQENSHLRDRLHENFHQSLVEIYFAVKKFAPFDLYICDGLQIFDGITKKEVTIDWGKIIISDDAIEADLKVLELLHKPVPEFLRKLSKKREISNN
ncbi:MAG: DUF362 domain-containing protein [Candidatus Heimdallarchaeota archaeon]|nr:DUF362 domain-containing protein [Candidatus Heimdallarchaeota archaeon]